MSNDMQDGLYGSMHDNMGNDMHNDMHNDMCNDMCNDMHNDMCDDMCNDMCNDMCDDMCDAMCDDMWRVSCRMAGITTCTKHAQRYFRPEHARARTHARTHSEAVVVEGEVLQGHQAANPCACARVRACVRACMHACVHSGAHVYTHSRRQGMGRLAGVWVFAGSLVAEAGKESKTLTN